MPVPPAALAIPVPAPPAVPAPDVPLQAPPQQHQRFGPAPQDPALVQAPQPQVLQDQKIIGSDHVLRDKLPVDYQEVPAGVKKKC